MTILYESIEFIASFIESFVLYKIYDVLVHKQPKMQNIRMDILLSIGSAMITRVCNHVSIFSYFTILIFILYASITARFFYRTNYITLFSIATFYVLCLSGFNFLIITLVSGIYGGKETFMTLVLTKEIHRMILIIIIKILWIIGYLGIRKTLYKFSSKKNYVYTILIVSCAGTLGFIYFVDEAFKAFDSKITGIWFVFLAYLALLLIVVHYVIESREEKMKLNCAEMRNKLLEENYEAINEIYMNNAKLYHDLNNHLNVLYQLLDEGNEYEAKKYIKEISKPIMKLSKNVWTGIDVIDVIISSKLDKIKEMGICAEINVEFPKNTNILPHDMCTILANLLDNAIEAAGALDPSGNISLTIRRINYFLLIRVTNSCVGNKEKFIHYPKTTKGNKVFHGWGLPGVMGTVEKYEGTFKCENEGNQFSVNIMLLLDEVAD